jgi:hypothetical protein
LSAEYRAKDIAKTSAAAAALGATEHLTENIAEAASAGLGATRRRSASLSRENLSEDVAEPATAGASRAARGTAAKHLSENVAKAALVWRAAASQAAILHCGFEHLLKNRTGHANLHRLEGKNFGQNGAANSRRRGRLPSS